MQTTTTAPELVVTLKGGLVVSVDALRVLWNLEDRGFDVELGDGRRFKVLVAPAHGLTDQDRAAIHTHRDALAELVRYVDRMASEIRGDGVRSERVWRDADRPERLARAGMTTQGLSPRTGLPEER